MFYFKTSKQTIPFNKIQKNILRNFAKYLVLNLN